MMRKLTIHGCWLAFVLYLFLWLAASPAQSQASTPEDPLRIPHGKTEFTFHQAASNLQAHTVAPTTIAARLPWSKVVFERCDEDRLFDIYIADDDGYNETRLTNDSSNYLRPRLNRGGTKIAYTNYSSAGNFDIYSMNSDGSSQLRLTTHSAQDWNPNWSPDGTKIAFESDRDGQREIYVMNANGSSQTRLTNNSGYDGEPYWSPDGSKIAFASYRSGEWRIWVMNADGSGQAPLSSTPYSAGPAWSPDGSQIAYDADGNGDGGKEVWLMNADGSGQHLIYAYPSDTDAYVWDWSPDGAWIAYTMVHWVQEPFYDWNYAYLSIIPADGSGSPMYLLGGDTDWYPDWETLDIQAPGSSVQALPAQSPGEFTVSWTGSDSGGAGIKNIEIQVRDGVAGVWTHWQNATGPGSAAYNGLNGHTYYFRSRAQDNAFNLETWPATYDAMTTVDSLPPVTSMTPLPQYSYLYNRTLIVSWTGSDNGGSGILHYDVQYKLLPSGVWTDWRMGTPETSYVYMNACGLSLAFRVRAMDSVGNLEAWHSEPGDTSTVAYNFGLSGTIVDPTGMPVEGVLTTADVPLLLNEASGVYGGFRALMGAPGTTVTNNWQKSGYGTLPDTIFYVPSANQGITVVLPPVDNVIVNPGLEFGGPGFPITPPWTASGVVQPVNSPYFHTGAGSVRLGSNLAPETGDSILSQTVTLPILMTNPVLSFLYWTEGPVDVTGSYFAVEVQDGGTITELMNTTAVTLYWAHRWFDLTPWAGKQITIRFRMHLQNGVETGFTWVDDVTIGGSGPDLWVMPTTFPSAFPGSQVEQVLAYGNRGAFAASAATLTMTLPDQLDYVSAEPAPDVVEGKVLTWDLVDLPPQSRNQIHLVTNVAAGAALLSTLDTSLEIAPLGNELWPENNTALSKVFVGARVFISKIYR